MSILEKAKTGAKKIGKWTWDHKELIVGAGVAILGGYAVKKIATGKNAELELPEGTITDTDDCGDDNDYNATYTMKFFDENGEQYGRDVSCYKSYADDLLDAY